jgi:hypothetical protein
MLQTIACAVAVLGLSSGVARADDLQGVITRIDADKLSFKKGTETKTYDLDKEVKVYRFAKKDQKELDPDGLKAEPLPNLPKGGVLAVIKVVDGKVTEITIPPKKKQ